MRQYICRKCNNLLTESSTCPNCGNRTELYEAKIYWCSECNVPVFESICDKCLSSCVELSTDVRPVFPKERLLIEILMGCPMKFKDASCFALVGGVYVFDGKKYKISQSDALKIDPSTIIAEMNHYSEANRIYEDSFFERDWVKKFIDCNSFHLNLITQEACDFIRATASKYGEDSFFVSFSGGKDSTVVSHLVTRALGKEEILHVYGNTTLEYPFSEEYVERFRRNHPRLPLITARNKDQDFYDLCDKIGPPSRVMRWCCTIFKTGAINKKIEALFENKRKVLAFHGIRRSESTSREKYDRISESPKISKQIVCQPIIDWIDFDIWLYLLANKIDFNDAYKFGFTRVGCWCCPNNTLWAGFLSSIYMNDDYTKFKNQLYEFAKKVGKLDWKEYIDTGKWKARQGGNGLELSNGNSVEYKPCVVENNAYNFELSRPIDERLYTLFKPFGLINHDLGNKRLGEVFVLNPIDNQPLLKLTGKIGQTRLRVTVLNYIGTIRKQQYVESYIKAQISKFQTCIGCSGCSSACKHAAIKIENTKPGDVSNDSIKYEIDSQKCVHCLDCVLHFDNGCYMRKVLRKQK